MQSNSGAASSPSCGEHRGLSRQRSAVLTGAESPSRSTVKTVRLEAAKPKPLVDLDTDENIRNAWLERIKTAEERRTKRGSAFQVKNAAGGFVQSGDSFRADPRSFRAAASSSPLSSPPPSPSLSSPLSSSSSSQSPSPSHSSGTASPTPTPPPPGVPVVSRSASASDLLPISPRQASAGGSHVRSSTTGSSDGGARQAGCCCDSDDGDAAEPVSPREAEPAAGGWKQAARTQGRGPGHGRFLLGSGAAALVACRSNYVVEDVSSRLSFEALPDVNPLIDVQRYTPLFELYLYPVAHRVYLSFVQQGDERVDPMFIIIERATAFSPNQRVLVRTARPYSEDQDADEWVLMPPYQQRLKKALCALLPELLPPAAVLLELPVSPQLADDLLKLERMLVVKTYKFGVVYRTANQVTESAMLCNRDVSPEFLAFLSVLGHRVDLAGFAGYRAGLDVNSGSTGDHSYYIKTAEDIEVMYHVATLLPYTERDEQQLEKKRHIGNDVVVFVFTEPSSVPFDPAEFVSEFNHVFIVVAPQSINGRLWFRTSVVSKDGVHSMDPPIPEPPLLDAASPKTRDFFLKKAINSERAAMYAPSFSLKIHRARTMLIQNLVAQYLAVADKKKKTKNPFKKLDIRASQRS